MAEIYKIPDSAHTDYAQLEAAASKWREDLKTQGLGNVSSLVQVLGTEATPDDLLVLFGILSWGPKAPFAQIGPPPNYKAARTSFGPAGILSFMPLGNEEEMQKLLQDVTAKFADTSDVFNDFNKTYEMLNELMKIIGGRKAEFLKG